MFPPRTMNDVNRRHRLNQTPLHRAAQKKNVERLQMLLRKGADVNAADHNESTPLHFATDTGTEDLVQIRLDNGADINRVDQKCGTALHYAVRRKSDILVRLLLDRGADVNQVNSGGDSPLSFSVDSTEMFELLVENNAELNDGSTLSSAVIYSEVELVRFLLENGADPNKCPSDLYAKPLEYALNLYDDDIVSLLVENGSDVNVETRSGKPVLYSVLRCGDMNLFRQVIDNITNFNLQTNTGVTTLMEAIRVQNIEAIQMLLDKNIDLNIQDDKGRSALHYACRRPDEKSLEIFQMLLARDIDVNLQDVKGFTPLHYVCQWRKEEYTKLLVENGANINMETNDGNKPLDLAAWPNKEYLESKGATKRPKIKKNRVKGECNICCDEFKLPVALDCGHVFCSECLETWFETKMTNRCPMCRKSTIRILRLYL